MQTSDDSCRSSEVVHRQVNPGFVQLISELQQELRAYLFLTVDVACVGQAASACRELRAAIWEDAAFWRVYAAVCLQGTPQQEKSATLRDLFRRWLFHLEGAWAKHYAEFAAREARSEFGKDYLALLTDAKHIVSGLMPSDCSLQVGEFVELLCSLLAEYSPGQLDERSMAEGLVAKVEDRANIFSSAQLRRVLATYEESLERAVLEQHTQATGEALVEPPPWSSWQAWELEEDADSDESTPGMEQEEDDEPNFAEWPQEEPIG